MKKIFLSIIAITVCLTLSAQTGEEILAKIEKAGAKGTAIEQVFSEVRSWADNARKSVTLGGNLKWKDGNLKMDYSNGDSFSIEGNTMTIKKAGKVQNFDLTKNMMMKGLSHALTYSFRGKLQELAQEQKAKLLASKEGNDFVVILNATQKAARGYNCITIRYNAKTCQIKSMKMDEFSGLSTIYSIE